MSRYNLDWKKYAPIPRYYLGEQVLPDSSLSSIASGKKVTLYEDLPGRVTNIVKEQFQAIGNLASARELPKIPVYGRSGLVGGGYELSDIGITVEEASRVMRGLMRAAGRANLAAISFRDMVSIQKVWIDGVEVEHESD